MRANEMKGDLKLEAGQQGHIVRYCLDETTEAELNKINLARDLIQDGIVRQGKVVLLRIWLPGYNSEGVCDLSFPKGEDSRYGFIDVYEAIVKEDCSGAFRLQPRNGGKDIPKQFYFPIEQGILLPFSMKLYARYQEHIFGKAMLYQVYEYGAKRLRWSLENTGIISPRQYYKMVALEVDENRPDDYDKVTKKHGLDYEAILKGIESDRLEFKASARWDYNQRCMNTKEMPKEIVKTVAGFLNHIGGLLLIGINDSRNVVGLEKDLETLSKKNLDGYMLFLTSLLSDHIGKEFHPFIHIKFPKIQGRIACAVHVEPASHPAYVKDGQTSRFYLRMQNQTRELDAKEAVLYIPSRFK